MPVAWTKTYTGTSGKPDRIFTTTMGHVMDFRNEGFRRMMVNACYWAVGLEKKISATGSVEFAPQSSPDRRTPRRRNRYAKSNSCRPLRHRTRSRRYQRAQPVGEIARLRRTPPQSESMEKAAAKASPAPTYPPPSPR